MDTSSPAVADAIALLRHDLYEHIDEIEFIAMKYGPWSDVDAEVARRAIPDLTTIIRGLLLLHEAEDTNGLCRSCATEWPCEAFHTIHRMVKDPDREFVKVLEKARGFD